MGNIILPDRVKKPKLIFPKVEGVASAALKDAVLEALSRLNRSAADMQSPQAQGKPGRMRRHRKLVVKEFAGIQERIVEFIDKCTDNEFDDFFVNAKSFFNGQQIGVVEWMKAELEQQDKARNDGDKDTTKIHKGPGSSDDGLDSTCGNGASETSKVHCDAGSCETPQQD